MGKKPLNQYLVNFPLLSGWKYWSLSTRPKIPVFIFGRVIFKWRMEQFFPESPEKKKTLQSMRNFRKYFTRKFDSTGRSVHTEFPAEFLVEWFAFRKFNYIVTIPTDFVETFPLNVLFIHPHLEMFRTFGCKKSSHYFSLPRPN